MTTVSWSRTRRPPRPHTSVHERPLQLGSLSNCAHEPLARAQKPWCLLSSSTPPCLASALIGTRRTLTHVIRLRGRRPRVQGRSADAAHGSSVHDRYVCVRERAGVDVCVVCLPCLCKRVVSTGVILFAHSVTMPEAACVVCGCSLHGAKFLHRMCAPTRVESVLSMQFGGGFVCEHFRCGAVP
jgi:hypothetical protein